MIQLFRWFEKNYLFSLAIAVLIAVFIFYMSAQSFSGYPGGFGINAKIYHIGIFFLLSGFILVTLVRGKKNKTTPILFALAILTATLYGCSDEIHQFFVPGRNCRAIDIFINFIGVSFAGMVYAVRLNLREKIKKPKK